VGIRREECGPQANETIVRRAGATKLTGPPGLQHQDQIPKDVRPGSDQGKPAPNPKGGRPVGARGGAIGGAGGGSAGIPAARTGGRALRAKVDGKKAREGRVQRLKQNGESR